MKHLPKRLYYWVVGAGRLATAMLAIWTVISIGVAWLVARGDVTVPAWAAGVLLFLVGVGLAVAFFAGRGRRLFPTTATELEGRLEIASNYLLYAEDFMSAFREAVSSGPAYALEHLPRLRELLLDAVVQSVNTEAGEHVRCALFVEHEDADGNWLIARYHRGHTLGVEQLRLHADTRSIAGTALATQEPIYVPDADADPRVQATTGGRHAVKTLLCLPSFPFVVGERTPLGILSVTSNKLDAFDEADQAFISLCANLIGLLEFATQLFESIDKLRHAVRVLEHGTGVTFGLAKEAQDVRERPSKDDEQDDTSSRPPSTV